MGRKIKLSRTNQLEMGDEELEKWSKFYLFQFLTSLFLLVKISLWCIIYGSFTNGISFFLFFFAFSAKSHFIPWQWWCVFMLSLLCGELGWPNQNKRFSKVFISFVAVLYRYFIRMLLVLYFAGLSWFYIEQN